MKFYESEYEEALINLLTDAGWEYTHGSTLHRNNREVLIEEDLRAFLGRQHSELEQEDIDEIVNHLRHMSGQTHFALLRATYQLLCNGYRYVRHSDGKTFDINYIDFDEPQQNNIFRVVNQFEVGYG